MTNAKLNAQFGVPSGGWKIRFLLSRPEGKAMFLTFVAPVLLLVAKFAVGYGWATLLLLFAADIALAYVIARGGAADLTAVNLNGKTAIVTGANVGIGAETVRVLAERGARVVLACRDAAKGETARAAIGAQLPAGCKGTVEVRVLDLSSKASIKAFADAWGDSDLHILVNNAGVMMCPYGTTSDGFETQIGTNHLGHMYLTLLLLPVIKRCAARVVTTTSIGHAMYSKVPAIGWAQALSPTAAEYNPQTAYGHSKLANILFTRELEKKLRGTGAHAYTCHPGAVQTDLFRHHQRVGFGSFAPLIFKTPLQGAQSQLHLAAAPNPTPVLFHSDCAPAEASPIAYSDESAAELWAESCRLLNVQA